MKVNLKEISELAGVSIMSVSRALNNKPGVSEKTRKKILNITRELGYVPNLLASALGRSTTRTVGVILPKIAHTIFPDMLNGIEQVLSASNYRFVLCCSYNNPAREFQEISALLERQVDGMIWVPSSLDESEEAAALLQKQNCPFVFMDRLIPGIDANAVLVDDYDGAKAAVTHLLEQGCRRIAHITSNNPTWISEERKRGYYDALKLNDNRSINEQLIVSAGTDIPDGEQAMQKLLNLTHPPDGVFCINDPVAIGAYKTLLKNNISIPEEIALVGFSGTIETEITAVPLTTVYQDGMAIGAQAARTLINQINLTDKDIPPVRQVLKTSLMVRKSSQCNLQ